MGDVQILLAALFVSAAGLNAVANWLEVPYPITLVIGGLALGLIPGIPDIRLARAGPAPKPARDQLRGDAPGRA